MRLDDLRDAIDPYRGGLRLSVPLGTLDSPTDDGFTLALDYDSGAVDATVVGWNLADPTGLAGLGWSLAPWRIEIERGDSLGSAQALLDPVVVLHMGGERRTLRRSGGDAATIAFTPDPFSFWKVTYEPGRERWTVILEDGVTLVFGDEDSGRGSVDFGYAWGNWIGASVATTARTRVATGWSLSERRDAWGNACTFTYEQVDGQLGTGTPVPYTRATYLKRVDGPGGAALALRYEEKQADEYADPHAGPSAAAWQSRFATRALAAIDRIAPGGAVLTTTTLGYRDPGGGLATIGAGDRTKRLLTGIARSVPGGYPLPELTLAYDRDPTSESYGALVHVTTEAGGVATVAYARPTLPLPQRDHALDPPTTPGVTYADPRVAFGDDYAVALWRGSDDSVAAIAYRWQGRWLPQAVVAPPAADAAAYAALRIVTGRSCFALVGAASYTLFHTDPQLPGVWVGSSAAEPLGLPTTAPIAAAGGDGAIALLATVAGTMIVRWFDGSAWRTLTAPAPAGTELAALDSAGDLIVRASTTGGRDHELLIARPDPTQGWTTRAFRVSESVAGLDGIAVTAGATAAVFELHGWSGSERLIVHDAVTWNADASRVQVAPLRRLTAAALPAPPQLRGATVLLAEDVYRFDGTSWRHQDLSRLVHPGQEAVVALTAGADVVTRAVRLTGGALVYDLIAYDPMQTGPTPWAFVPGMSGVPAKPGATTAMAARFGPGEPGAASRVVLVDNRLYQLAGDGTWPRLLEIEATFTEATIASLQLWAAGYLAYQDAAGVHAYPLRPGGLGADSGISLSGAKLLPAAGAALTGETAFAAYTGTWNGPDMRLRLYRPVAEDVRGPLAPLTVAKLVLYGNGEPGQPGPLPYDAVPIAYELGAATATAAPDGRRPAANRATIATGSETVAAGTHGTATTWFFNDLTAAEAPDRPYPTGDGDTNAATHLAELAGLAYAQETRAAGAGTAESLATAWWWVTRRPAGVRHAAGYSRCRKEANAVDGVPQERTIAYSTDTGLPVESLSALPDGRRLRTTYGYWWEHYDPTRARNLLTPVVQAMEYAEDALVSGVVVTWSDQWGSGGDQWAPRATFRATDAQPAVFDAWHGEATPAGWQLEQAIVARAGSGLALRTQDALGQTASSIVSADETRQLAAFANADVDGQEAYWWNCEPYESSGPWTYHGGGTIGDHLVRGEANLGTQSLGVAFDANGGKGPQATFQPDAQARSYLVGCWVQTGPTFAGEGGAAQLDVTAATVGAGSQPIGSVSIAFGPTNGRWQYVSVVVPLGVWRTQHGIAPTVDAAVTLSAWNSKPTAQVLVDGLRFQPLDGSFFGEVPDPETGLPLGSVEANGATFRLIRDANRIVTATVGPDLSVARLAIPSFARLLTPDRTYTSALPNAMLEASAGSDAIYQDFEASDAGEWTRPAGWSVGGGRLAYAGGAVPVPGSRASLTAFRAADYVASVRFLPPESGAVPDVGIGCGNAVVVHRAASDDWVLMTQAPGGDWVTSPPQAGPLGRGDLTFALLGRRVTVFAAGRQVFSRLVPDGVVPDGTLGVTLSGPGAFRDLVALAEPDLRLTLADGRGLAQQAIDLRSADSVDAYGAVGDSAGYLPYDKNPASVALAFHEGTRIAGAPDDYLPLHDGQQQTLAEYLSYGRGSPFVRSVLDASPLARLRQLGLPGDELAVGGGHATALGYARNTPDGPMSGVVPPAQAGNYDLTTITDPDAHPRYRLVAPGGQRIADRVPVAAGAVTRGYRYDATGALVAATPPNAYAQPAHAGEWESVWTRDFLGRATAVTTPDAGTAKLGYDVLGRLRLEQSAADAAAGVPRIGYRRYDGLDRLVEQGSVSGVDWATAVAAVATDPTWPGAAVTHHADLVLTYDALPPAPPGDPAPADSGGPALAGAGDSDGPARAGAAAELAIPTPSCTEGRLVQATRLSAAGAVAGRETSAYDVRGNTLTTWTEAPGFDATIWRTSYAYDSRDALIEMALPMAITDGSPPLTVAYTRDRDGRVVAVGTPPPDGFVDPLNPPPDERARFARFSYDADGRIVSASYENTDPDHAPIVVAHEHTPAGWPTATTSPVFEERVAYLAGGYGGAGSYRGTVASVARTWKHGADAPYPVRAYTARFAYDEAERMIAAAPYLAPGAQPALDAGGPAPPIQLDPNGNALAIQRGEAISAYEYPQPTSQAALASAEDSAAAPAAVRPSDLLQRVVTTIATTCSFDGVAPHGWSWGASDGCPGCAAIVDGGPSGTRCLQLSADALGTAAVLAYRGYVDPRGTFTLRYQLQADAAFAAQHGTAGWYLDLHGPEGVLASVLVQELTNPSTTWTEQTVSFDLASVYRAQGGYAQVVEVTFALRNAKRDPGGGAGAALRVDDLVLSGNGSTGTFGYDASGRVTEIAGAGLTAVSYAPDSSTVVAYHTAARGGYTMDYVLDPDGQPLIRVADPEGPAGERQTSLFLRTPDGELIARLDRTGGTVRRRSYIVGPQGALAVHEDDSRCYLLRAYDGEVRAVAGPAGELLQCYDDDAFGQLQCALADGPDPLGRIDPLSGLDLDQEAPYAPWLGRALAPPPPPREIPPAHTTGAPPGADWEEWFVGAFPERVQSPVRFAWWHFVGGTEAMSHNPWAWAPRVALSTSLLAASFVVPVPGIAGLGLALSPWAEGIRQYQALRSQHRACQDRGLQGVQAESFVEDIYHALPYTSLEEIGGKRLRLRSVEPIPDGFYIFVVNEENELLYRTMTDRSGGNELYVRHSQLNSGRCARSAGMFMIFGEEIVLTNQSGHYGMGVDSIWQHAVPLLRAAGYERYRMSAFLFTEFEVKRKMKEFAKRTGTGV